MEDGWVYVKIVKGMYGLPEAVKKSNDLFKKLMRLPIKTIPQEIIDKYNLNDILEDIWVYVKIVRGMYSFPEAEKIANDLLKKRLGRQATTQVNSHKGCGEMCGDPSPSR